MTTSKITFSRTAIDALPLPEAGRRSYYHDTRQPGLLLMVTSTGTKTFQLYVKHDGRPVRVTLGRFSRDLAEGVELPRDSTHSRFLANNPELNVRMARDLAARVKIDLKSGVNPTDIKRARRAELTLGEMFEEYVTKHLDVENKNSQEVRYDFERLLGALPDTPQKKRGSVRVKTAGGVNWQNRKLSSISNSDVQKVIADITRESSKENANRALKVLRAMYNKAILWKLFDKANPCEGVTQHKTKARDRFLQSDEMPRYFNSVLMDPNPSIRDFYLLAPLTGARKTNILEMRWEDINWKQATWTVPGELTKNGDPVVIPLVDAAITILDARKPEKPATYVFPGKDGSGHMMDPRKGWERIMDRDEVLQLAQRIEAAGGSFPVNFDTPDAPNFNPLATSLKKARQMAQEMELDTHGCRMNDLRPHDLRRTLGSWQAAGGSSLQIIGKSLGHRSQAATIIYAHLNIDPVRASVDKATQAMLSAAGLTKKTSTDDQNEDD